MIAAAMNNPAGYRLAAAALSRAAEPLSPPPAPSRAAERVNDAPVRITLSDEAAGRAGREALLRDVIERNLEIDPSTRAIVYQAVDTRSGGVVYQLPSDAALKMRVYARTMAVEQAPRPGEGNTVIL